MAVFISHAGADKDAFDLVADALERAQLPYWSSGTLLPGAPLSDQLRDAVGRTALCIFVATRGSVESAVCGAELGAFWGAGKPVLIFLADVALTEGTLPPQFLGHFLERRVARIVDAVTRHLTQREASARERPAIAEGPGLAVSREDLQELLEAALDRTHMRSLAVASMRRLAVTLAATPRTGLGEAETTVLRSSLYSLLGLPRAALEDAAPAEWPHRVAPFTTTAGEWEGYAQNENWVSHNAVLTPCLVVRYDARRCVLAAALLPQVVEFDQGGTGVSEPMAIAGRGQLGKVDP